MRPDLPQEHKPNNPFHVLKDLPAQPKPAATRIRKSREFDFVQPFYLKKLLDFCGSTKETGERIGITDSSVSEGIRTGKIRKITELAARAVYELDCVPPPVAQIDTRGRVFVSMLIDREAYEALKPWLDSAGATHKTLI